MIECEECDDSGIIHLMQGQVRYGYPEPHDRASACRCPRGKEWARIMWDEIKSRRRP